MSSKAFLSAVKARRSFYKISAQSKIEPAAIKEIIDQAVMYTPTPYNTQGGRVVLLFGDAHEQAWDVIKQHTMKWLSGNEAMVKMQGVKIDGYTAGYGTVCFLEDQDTIEASKKKTPMFNASNLFETWAHESSAMLQYIVWTALEAEGFGASLQHHTAMMDSLTPALQRVFDIPTSWKVTAMMPFGVPTGEPGQTGAPVKTFMPINERVIVLSKASDATTPNGAAVNGSTLKKVVTNDKVQVEAS